MSRREFFDGPENGFRARGHSVREVIFDRSGLDRAGDAGTSEDCFQFGSEDQTLRVAVEVERLEPQAIPGEHQFPSVPIPEGKREQAAEPFDERTALLFTEMNQNLGIAFGAEPMSARLELTTQLLVVVDLAVERWGDDRVAKRAPSAIGLCECWRFRASSRTEMSRSDMRVRCDD
jgi:hypothetical protein